jgi:LuxR family maltose regulon positive regulatory protein
MFAFAVANLGLAESALGVTSHADPMLDPVMEILVRIGAQDSVVGALVRLALGERERRRGDVRGALTEIDRAIEALGHLTRSAWLVNAYLLRAVVQGAIGMPEALASVDNAERVLHRLSDPGSLPERAAALRAELSGTTRHATEFGEQLSERELVVLRLAAEGLNQRQIAEQLYISYNTVKSHLRAAYRKLGVASREEAIARLEELSEPSS